MDLIEANANETHQPNDSSTTNARIRICKHMCEKKRRQCKFNAIRNSDFCVEHVAYNTQVN